MKIERRGDAAGEQEAPQREEMRSGSSRRREISVIIYITVLFVAALALILLSYKIQQRTSNTISDINEQHGAFTTQALKNIEELQKQNQELTAQLDSATDSLDDAERTIEELRTSLSGASAEVEALSAQIEELRAERDALEKRVEATDTLLRLLSAEDDAERAELLRQMEELSQYLDADAAKIYNACLENTDQAGE